MHPVRAINFIIRVDYIIFVSMNTTPSHFNVVVESVYNLPLDEKLELKNLLEHNIADAVRNDILSSYEEAQNEYKNGKLNFSSDPDELMNML